MKIIEIIPLDNGAHRNQTLHTGTVPEGWAVIPDDMECKNFPFGEIIVEKVGSVPTVVSWIPVDIPEPEPTPVNPESDITWDSMAEAITEGVNEV